jgi:hypothetical protein
MIDAEVLEQVLSALARGTGEQAGQRAGTVLSSVTARLCERFSAEARAVAADHLLAVAPAREQSLALIRQVAKEMKP